jgi:drug/metabolite transporter (DMT)-like permease
MKAHDNVIVGARETGGILLGALGVLSFSFSLPATRLAVTDLDPWLVSFGRAAGAGLLATAYLVLRPGPWPDRAGWRRVLLVAGGIVVGFPLFSSLALTGRTSAHGAVVIAGLPMATAMFAVLRAGERPRGAFWLASGLGMVAVTGFVATTGGLSDGIAAEDAFLLTAMVLAGLGYAEGGVLARDLGGPRTISLALVASLPVTLPVTALAIARSEFDQVTASAWLGFGYVTVVSMYLGFFAWYAALASGGVARIGQIQLAQPVLTFAWAALLLNEQLSPLTVAAGLVVLTCVVLTQRTREPEIR